MPQGGKSGRDAGVLLLPLRGFLAVVFLYGGISKIADPRFLDGTSPLSMHASVRAARAVSPIGGLLGPVESASVAFGVVFAVAELAVGLGVLLGLFTRVAAAGGMLLSLSLWLTVSWGASPWFTSADLVYLFAFTPLLLAGAGALSLDGWLDRAWAANPEPGADRTRRGLLAVGATALGAAVLGIAALSRPGGRPAGQRDEAAVPPADSARDSLVPTDQVPVGGGTEVTGAADQPVWVLQLEPGAFTAFDARCPHQGCTVEFVSSSDGFSCPCHRSRFDAQGRRISGPAPRGLTQVPVLVRDGEVRAGDGA